MDTLSYKTVSANKNTVKKEWHVIDARDLVVGRLASKVAMILRGKHKPSYTPHVDCGDNVVVVNADLVRFTGKKLGQKQYFRHTGYPGGERFTSAREMMRKDSRRVVESAVRGMLPKNRLGRKLFNNLFVYAGAEHPHEAQQPKELTL